LTVAVSGASLPENVIAAFKNFQTKYNKHYESEEWAARAQIFAHNLDRVSTLNNEHLLLGGDAVHGVTKFMDMTSEEFKATYLTYTPRNESSFERVEVEFSGTNAAKIDWLSKGAVTDVKDQGQCGSCWAFSATEAIESYAFLAGQPLYELSAQQITSCDKTDAGCNGGNTETAYEYLEDAGGLDLEADYPYKSGDGKSRMCKAKTGKYAVEVKSYKSVKKGEANLEKVLNEGPVSICVAADSFQTYNGGILKSCPGQIDHCVQAVGYTANYWLVRNSWATDWGEDGYIRVARGKNLCRISNDVTYPTF